jgi:hypothetical protein
MKRSTKKLTRAQKALKYTGYGFAAFAAFAAIRETYLAFGSRRERRRSVYEQALKRAHELGVPLIVLGDPDGGLMNHMLGRQWQCGTLPNEVICIDPKGCGLCSSQVQGWPEDVLGQIKDHSAVIFDPGAFAMANDGVKLAQEMQRVALQGEVYFADVEPWSLAAFFEPARKRRVLVEPQVSATRTLSWKPTWFRREPSGSRAEQTFALRGLGSGVISVTLPHVSGDMFGVGVGMTHPPIARG